VFDNNEELEVAFQKVASSSFNEHDGSQCTLFDIWNQMKHRGVIVLTTKHFCDGLPNGLRRREYRLGDLDVVDTLRRFITASEEFLRIGINNLPNLVQF